MATAGWSLLRAVDPAIDLAAVRTRAVPSDKPGAYKLYGQKIFITYGEQDYTDNIIHLVLARTPDAPEVKAVRRYLAEFLSDRRVIEIHPLAWKPILHGMCTYGITCRGVLQTYADYDPTAFRQHAVRFSSPVYPGETVTMDLWKDGNVISFEAKVKARNVAVIKSGRTVLG